MMNSWLSKIPTIIAGLHSILIRNVAVSVSANLKFSAHCTTIYFYIFLRTIGENRSVEGGLNHYVY